jgi:PAS domain S-box-containing protein
LNVEARTTELKETNARLETLLQSIPDIVAFKDANGRHILTNKALEEFMGLSHDALSGKTVEDIFPPEIAVLCRQNDERAMRSPGPIRSEESIGKGAGRVILDTIKTPVRDEDGNVKGLVMVGRDITERKHAEEALQQAREQLEQRVQERTLELQKTHAQLLHAEKLSAIGSLSASIAHEFNNPLFGVMNVLSGIKRKGAVSENIEEMVEMAIKECHRMKNLIIDLQDFNRPTSGIVGPMDIHACIDSILLLSKKEFFAKKISIEKKYGENIPEIKAVNDQIKQVFLNLLNNAADACTGIENATITIRTALTDKETLTIRIQDTGKGIKPEHMGRIFDPFFTTKPEIKGTGLGLSISYGIIKKHGGRIDVESEEGKGTTVTVTLPREASQV